MADPVPRLPAGVRRNIKPRANKPLDKKEKKSLKRMVTKVRARRQRESTPRPHSSRPWYDPAGWAAGVMRRVPGVNRFDYLKKEKTTRNFQRPK